MGPRGTPLILNAFYWWAGEPGADPHGHPVAKLLKEIQGQVTWAHVGPP
jgi:hypothetical protein